MSFSFFLLFILFISVGIKKAKIFIKIAGIVKKSFFQFFLLNLNVFNQKILLYSMGLTKIVIQIIFSQTANFVVK